MDERTDPLREFGHAVGLALTDRKVPSGWDADNLTPVQMLEATASLLDKLDDATDAFAEAMYAKHPDLPRAEKVSRTMQRDLRAIALTLGQDPQ